MLWVYNCRWSYGKFEVVEVDNETEEVSVDSGSEDLDYNLKNHEVFDDDDEHILEDVPISMSNLIVNPDTNMI